MANLLQQLVHFASAHPALVGVIVFVSAAAESIIVVGAFYPGTSIVLALAGVSGATHGNIWLLTLWAAMGAITGDGISYWIGHRYGDQLQRRWPFKRRPELLERGAAFFARHGGKSVFFARFLPGVRAVVPVAAGILGMPMVRFTTANVASAALWALSHVLPAAGIGVAFATLGNMSGRLALLLGIALASAIIVFWLARVTIRWLAPMAARAYEGAVARLGQRPDRLSRRLARTLDPAQPRLAAIALWSGVLVVAATGFLGVLEDLVAGDPLVRADTAINHLVQSLRTPLGDTVMVVITALGDTVVITTLTVLVVGWLVLRRAYSTAGAVALTMGVSAIFVPVMKSVLHKSRPIDIYSGAEIFSFPSGHTALSTVLFGMIAVLVCKSLPRPVQIISFSVAGVGAGAIGLSRVYLSAHWPSDVLGGFLFGAGMVAVFALVFEHLPAEKIGRAGLAALAVAGFASVGAWHATRSMPSNLALYAPQASQASLDFTRWYSGGWRDLPASRTDLGGEFEEPLIVQWAGDKDQLATRLAPAGWQVARRWSARDALQFLNPAATLADLPPLPLMSDGRFPVLTMIRTETPGQDRRVVFRAWSTPVAVVNGATAAPLLVGSLTLEGLSHPFGLITTLRDKRPPDSAIPALARALRAGALHANAPSDTAAPVGGERRITPILALPAGSPLGTWDGTGRPGPGARPSPPDAKTAP